MTGVLDLAQMSVAGVVLAHGAWWTTLSLLALPRPKTLPVTSPDGLQMVVVVPAHNEQASIGNTVDALVRSAASAGCRVVVVADNCHDRTAEVAREHGATVIERSDHTLRGKPFALRFAMDYLRSLPEHAHVVAVVDADTEVSADFVPIMAARVHSGALAVQAHYRACRATTDLGGLRGMAFSLVHWARPLGASRLGLGVGLKGNGMAFSWDAALMALHGEGLAEDAAAGLALAERGITVAFEPRARVQGLMAQTYEEAKTQDARWEGGRAALMRRALFVGLKRLLRGDLSAAAAAFDTASLPLSMLGLLAAAAVMASVAGIGSLGFATLAAGSLVGYVTIGLFAARTPLRELRALAGLPRFLVHKAAIYGRIACGRGVKGWERTGRAQD